jgi:hypothetical protein
MFWLAVIGFAAAAVWIVARIRRKIAERERAAEARAAELLASLAAGSKPAAAAPALTASPAPAGPAPRPVRAAPIDDLAQQKLLFEAAHKAGEAGEPALAIQLYSRLLARYPATAFAGPAREAAEAQKKKLPK